MDLRPDSPDRDAGGIVADPTILDDADVDFHNVTILYYPPGPPDAMDDLFIDGNADLTRKTFVVEKSTAAAGIGHELGGSTINFRSADA